MVDGILTERRERMVNWRTRSSAYQFRMMLTDEIRGDLLEEILYVFTCSTARLKIGHAVA